MKLQPHITFNGNCEEAFTFYAQLFGGSITIRMTYAESPMADMMPPDQRHKLIHAGVAFQGQEITGDDGPGPYKTPQGIMLTLNLADPPEAERIFTALAQGGKITVPLGETFWAVRFGMLVDRFGVPWMVNCGKPEA
jgi:PhnB protein